MHIKIYITKFNIIIACFWKIKQTSVFPVSALLRFCIFECSLTSPKRLHPLWMLYSLRLYFSIKYSVPSKSLLPSDSLFRLLLILRFRHIALDFSQDHTSEKSLSSLNSNETTISPNSKALPIFPCKTGFCHSTMQSLCCFFLPLSSYKSNPVW